MELPKKITHAVFAERDRLPLWVPVLLATGIGLYFTLPAEPSSPWPAVAALAMFSGWAWFRRRSIAMRLIGIMGLLIVTGFLAAMFRTQSVEAPVLRKPLFFREVEGRIDDLRIREKGEQLILSQPSIEGVQERTTPARISVSLRKIVPELDIGDRIRVKAMLFPPPTPAYPEGYDFARGFYYDRLGAVGFSPYAPEVVAPAGIGSFEVWLNDVRFRLAGRIQAGMAPENGPVASALMVGEESAVTEEVKESMRDSGLYHVLSISGLHMSLAVGLVYLAVRFLLSLYMPLALRLPVKKIAAAVGLLSALAYLLLAGYPVPAVRSFVMVACVLVAVLFDRRGISLYSLAWAATLILLAQPESLLGASFQLSFAATLAIIALYERYSALLYTPGRGIVRTFGTYFIGLLFTSLAATLATTPLVIYHFNRFTLWGIIANTLMVPLASFWIMPAAVLAFLAMPFGLEAWPLAALDRGIGLMLDGSKWFAGLPYANFSLPSPTFAGFLMIVFGGLWLCLWQKRWRLIGIPVAVAGLLTLLLYKPYDIWISDDASKVMVRMESGEFLFLRGRATGFEAEAWLRAAGSEKALTLADMKQRPDAPRCDKDVCVMELRGVRLAVAQRKKLGEALCREKADVIIAQDVRVEEGCAGASRVYDLRALDRSGAVGIRITAQGLEIHTASEHRGKRPWVAIPYETRYATPSENNRGPR